MCITACMSLYCVNANQPSTDLRHVLNVAADISSSHFSGVMAAGSRWGVEGCCSAAIARASCDPVFCGCIPGLPRPPALLRAATDGLPGVGMIVVHIAHSHCAMLGLTREWLIVAQVYCCTLCGYG